MKCPKCGHDMEEEDLEGVNVDRCSFCEGSTSTPASWTASSSRRKRSGKGFFRRLVKI